MLIQDGLTYVLHICWFNFDGSDRLSWTQQGLNSWPPDWGNIASCQLSSMFASCHWNCVTKHNPNDMPEAALDNWQPIWNAQESISTPVVLILLSKAQAALLRALQGPSSSSQGSTRPKQVLSGLSRAPQGPSSPSQAPQGPSSTCQGFQGQEIKALEIWLDPC